MFVVNDLITFDNAKMLIQLGLCDCVTFLNCILMLIEAISFDCFDGIQSFHFL